VIRLTRPSVEDVADLRSTISGLEPTYPASGSFREVETSLVVGQGPVDFEAAKQALRDWRMQRDTGVHVEPVPLAVGENVVLWTRVIGVWLLFSCRIIEVVDLPTEFGFTYATMPGHPERGRESFVLHRSADGEIVLRIHAVSRPNTLMSRVSGPIGRAMQRRYMQGYVEAVRAVVAGEPGQSG